MENKESTNAADPFDAFSQMRGAYLEAMSKAMIDAVNTEQYAQISGTLLTNYLTLAAPFRDVLDKTMMIALEQLSLPSRQQVTSLAERFTNLEVRLDDLDAKLDRIVEATSIPRPITASVTPVPKQPTKGETKSNHHASGKRL